MMKHALITGASKGIGLATAQHLNDKGWNTTGIGREFSTAQDGDMEQVALDLAQLDTLPESLNQPALQVDFDALILAAGYGLFGGLEQFSHRQIRELIDTNLVSNLFIVKHFLPRFKRQGGKDIVIVGSESALTGAKQGSLYCASKFALRGFAQSLRADCAAADIRVMLINPGPVASEFFSDLHFAPKHGADYSLSPATIATTIGNALDQPRNTVQEEIIVQPVKRAFEKQR